MWRKRVGKRGLDHRERMPGIEGKGAGMRGLEGGGRVPENEAWSVEEGCRVEEGWWKTRLGVWKKGAGKRGLECGRRVLENEAWSVEEGCRKTRLGVWRKGAGKRGLECGERVSESEAWRMAGGCRNERFMVWRKSAGMRGWSVRNSDNKQPSVRLPVPCFPPMGLFLISQSTALPRWNTADAENMTPSAEGQDPAKIRSLL